MALALPRLLTACPQSFRRAMALRGQGLLLLLIHAVVTTATDPRVEPLLAKMTLACVPSPNTGTPIGTDIGAVPGCG